MKKGELLFPEFWQAEKKCIFIECYIIKKDAFDYDPLEKALYSCRDE